MPKSEATEATGSKSGPDLLEGGNNPLFFNCHEFLVTKYRELGEEVVREHTEDEALCITHFPNIYCPQGSVEFDRTRIVRLPRRFEESMHYPSFSTELPGHEPAALQREDEARFTPAGFHDGHVFGRSSLSPLSNYVSPEECRDVVRAINGYLKEAYRVQGTQNILFNALDVLTFYTVSLLLSYFRRRTQLEQLEDYVEEVNERFFEKRGIRIISPRRSAYLSVCT